MARERVLNRIADRARDRRAFGQLPVAFRERGLRARRRIAVDPFGRIEHLSTACNLRLGQHAGNVQHHVADSMSCDGSCMAAARNASSGDDAKYARIFATNAGVAVAGTRASQASASSMRPRSASSRA